MRGISKSFVGVPVLTEVDLDLYSGEVHAVVGENGAGKSTLMKVLAGVHEPDAGTVALAGRQVSFAHPVEAQAAGVAIIYQELTLLADRTVAENVFLGREPTKPGLLRGIVDRKAMAQRTADLLADLGEDSIDPHTPVRRLSVAQQQVVEIVKALAGDARIVVMDEPTAALADHEVELLYSLVRRLAERGIGILYISHRMREIFDLSQRVTVLKDGRRTACRSTGEVTADDLVRLMVGRELSDYYPDRAAPADLGDVRLRLTGAGNARLRDIDLSVRAGEIVGIAGLQGAGRSSLAHAVFGADPFTTGEMVLDGAPVRPASPRAAIRAGIGLVTEDRKAEGLALRQSIRDNALLVVRGAFAGRRRAKTVDVTELLAELRIGARGSGQEVRLLSGGNQQKVVLAKWLAVRPGVLVLDEPTRGVDVGAKAAIHELVRDLARQGMAVLMVSSELPELIGMSDRIVVLRDGAVAGELPPGVGEEEIMRLSTGAGSAA
ncbi:sugar ABC transporter ATP-binding protein [Actinoalloteichus hymeniacidonis]|nr:sugar ABC transporter ATP-binding protein [Actinoalloteichus hymeniacidonis]MBB5907643.1 ribose transport system ATP-binding protein [Actinoalloteichus hymeniacidonis]